MLYTNSTDNTRQQHIYLEHLRLCATVYGANAPDWGEGS